MTQSRDNFTAKTVEILAKRVGFICSNPYCTKNTVGPNHEADKFTLVGVAAHITAAAPGGPRYDNKFSIEQRKEIKNGIWLCTDCSTIIDKDPKSYPVELLLAWKDNAESEMNAKLKGIVRDNARPILEADLIWSNSQRFNRGLSKKNKELYGDFIVCGANKPIIYWDLKWNLNLAIYNNSSFPAFNIKIEKIAGNDPSYFDKLPRINNLAPYGDMKLNAHFEMEFEGTFEDADKLILPEIPGIIQGLQLRLTYSCEKRIEYTTLFSVQGDKLINEII